MGVVIICCDVTELLFAGDGGKRPYNTTLVLISAREEDRDGIYVYSADTSSRVTDLTTPESKYMYGCHVCFDLTIRLPYLPSPTPTIFLTTLSSISVVILLYTLYSNHLNLPYPTSSDLSYFILPSLI